MSLLRFPTVFSCSWTVCVCVVRMLRVYFITNSAADYTFFQPNQAIIEGLVLIVNIAKYR